MKLNFQKVEFKKFDFIIIGAIIVISLLTSFIFISKNKIAKTPVIAENTVVFQVLFRGITLTSSESPFKPMDETFITIRNVPHKKITILDAHAMPRLTVITDARGRVSMTEDVSTPFMYDCLVTVFDEGKITEDGAVLGGNKLKIGLPIILEGKNYRFGGTVSDIKILNEKESEELKNSVTKEKERLKNIKTPELGLSLKSSLPRRP